MPGIGMDSPYSCKPLPIKKVPTHIQGLDEILDGGLPEKQSTLVIGQPGCGKTIFGMEFLYQGALYGEPGIFVGFEEASAQIKACAASLGWDFEKLEKDGKLFFIEGRIEPETIFSGDFSFTPMLSIIAKKAKDMGAKRIVFDAFDVLLRLLDDPIRIRSELFALNDWIASCGMTSVMTLKPRDKGKDSVFTEFFDSMATCVIFLDTRVNLRVTTRSLRVMKYRGSDFGRNEYPYVINGTGIHVVPITSASLAYPVLGERISTGIKELDEMLGSGLRRGAVMLVAGEPGVGKSILSATISRETCRRDERVLYVSFEESGESFLENVSSAGIDLGWAVVRELLMFVSDMPESTGAEEHLLNLIDAVERFLPDLVVIDAISACERMGGIDIAYDFLMRVLNLIKHKGITGILVSHSTGSRIQKGLTGMEISSMIDTVLVMTYVAGEKETTRTIEVLKSRGSAHSNRVRSFSITDNGIVIGKSAPGIT